MEQKKTRYPSDVSDEEWEFAAPYLCLLSLEAGQRKHDLREVFNALRYLVKTGAPWRYLPDSFPPWPAVYQQTQRWIQAGVFEDMADDLRELLRIVAQRNPQPSAAIFDAQSIKSTPESGERAGYDAGKNIKGTKIHLAVDTLGHLLALAVTPANEQERDQAAELARQVQAVTGNSVELAYVDQGYTGDDTKEAVAKHGIRLEVVQVPKGTRGFVLLPRRWVVERSFGWKTRFRRLVRDYERLPETVAGLHFAVFAIMMLVRLVATATLSS